MSRAIGPSAINIKRIQDKIGKRVRIIQEDEGLSDIKRFIEDIVTPVKLKSVEMKDGAVIVAAGSNQNKAALIGRNKRRFLELQKIVKNVYGLDLRII